MRWGSFAGLAALVLLCGPGCSSDEQTADQEESGRDGAAADADAAFQPQSPQAATPGAPGAPPSDLPSPSQREPAQQATAARGEPEAVAVTIHSPPDEIADFLADAESAGQITLLAAFRRSLEDDPARAVDVLAAILESDSRQRVRREIIELLAHPGLRSQAERTVPILLSVLDDPDGDEQTVLAAIRALRRVGRDAQAALPRLRELAEDERYADAANEAIARIESQ